MLSEDDKREMLEDARSPERREAFRKAQAFQETRKIPWPEYLKFLDEMASLFPSRKKIPQTPSGCDFRL